MDPLRRLLLLLPLALIAFGALSSEAVADDEEAVQRALERARQVEADLVGVLERVTDASVTVVHHARLPARLGGGRDGPMLVNGAGSGVIVSYRGTHVITNAHVVANASNVEVVTRDGTRIPVSIRARDEARDLAILSFKTTPKDVKAVSIEKETSSELREGAWVLATGNPFMLAQDGYGAATLGVFSGARGTPARGATSGAGYLLQHDAEINPGNSGGPLWSRRGDLLGINGAIVTRSMQMGGGPSYTGTSISVPVTQVREFLDRTLGIATTSRTASKPAPKPAARPAKRPRRAGSKTSRLGLRLVNSRDNRNQPDGALVVGVSKKSTVSASRTRDGLQSGDRITHISVSGTRYTVRSSRDFESQMTKHAGGTISIHYVRFGRTRTWTGPVDTSGAQ